MSLTNIAAQLRATVRQQGEASRRLAGGLLLRMCLVGDTWGLTLSRVATPPSATEISTVRRDFAIPASAQLTSAGFTVVLRWSDQPAQLATPERPAVVQERLL